MYVRGDVGMSREEIKKQELEEEKIEDEVVEEEEEEEGIIEETSANADDITNKLEEVLAKLGELRELIVSLSDAIRAGADATKGLHEVLTKIAKEIEKPEQVNAEAEQERKEKPKEPEVSESAVENANEIADPDRVQRQPEYEVGKEIRKRRVAVTPRPGIERTIPNADDDVREFLKSVLAGKKTVGEVNEYIKNKLFRGGV